MNNKQKVLYLTLLIICIALMIWEFSIGEYKIYKCPEEVSLNELYLICDEGNLCFGGRGNKSFINISED